MALKKYELVGQRFGKLTVIAETQKTVNKSMRRWRSRCDCGNEFTCSQVSLLNGKAYSCGCASTLRLRRLYGQKIYPKEYRIWLGIVERCTNPNYKRWADYGGRGIKVCERWRKFYNFITDMGPRPSDEYQIDRINNNGNYEPINCRWATRLEQVASKRNTRLLTVDGITKPIVEWARQYRISPILVWQRIKRDGMTAEQALGSATRKPLST